MKAHLLHPHEDFDFERPGPPNHEDLVKDLELTAVLQAMARGDKFLAGIARTTVLAGLDDPAVIRYRQEVLRDCIAEPEIVREIYALAVAALADKRGLWGFSTQNPASVLAGAVGQLETLISRLAELRKIADGHAAKFRSAGLTAFFGTLRRELDDDYFEELNQHLRQLRFRDGYLISAELGRDNSGIRHVLRSGNAGAGWKERLGIAPRTRYSFTIAPRDDAGAEALADLSNRAINHVANAVAQSADHVTSYFTRLRAELGFYVAGLNLRDELTARNSEITFPEPSPARIFALSGTDLRDASLALRIEHVTGNDIDADGKSLVVITGANSGGKSTFLRSVGLAQLMMQCGLFVTAQAYRSSISHGTFTHFIREEDPAMVSGRLDEELTRMSAIADQLSPHSLILLNESFAATNEQEGSEIGRQVTRALLEAGIRVLLVTHHYDLAHGFHRDQSAATLFLRAGRQPDGQRTYRLTPAEPLPTSYGQDIYHKIGGLAEGPAPAESG